MLPEFGLQAISSSRTKGLARTQSVPGRFLREEPSAGAGGGGGSRLHRTSSTGVPIASAVVTV